MVVCENSHLLTPDVKRFVEELFTSEIFSRRDLELVTPLSGLSPHDIRNSGECVCDRFKLVLPFAGYSVVWEVIFDGTCPKAPPDFIFDDESFLCECDLDSIPSLIGWDAFNEKSLVLVISDLLKMYSKYQLAGVERSVGPVIGKWLDPDNVEDDGVKVEILNGSQKSGPYSTLSRQANASLQYGTTSVLVEMPVLSDLLDSKILQFSVQYTFKYHTLMYEEKINCSPELEGWLRPYSDHLKKKNKWSSDLTTLSAAVQSLNKEIKDLLRRSVQEFKYREELQFSVNQNIMSHNDLNPTILEFDFNEFQFSSYLIRSDRLFSVDFSRGYPRGRLFMITSDCYNKPLAEVSRDNLNHPKFDIADVLSKFDS